jgi:restriction system protein
LNGIVLNALLRKNRTKPAEIPVPQEWSLDVLQSLEWKRFETVCAEHIRMTGYEPKETRIGADGGVDIWVYKPGVAKTVGIVQCKAWKSYKVGVKPVRELLGVMAKERVAQGKFITSGEFTAEALAFVEGENLKLITGEMFLASIRKLLPEKQKELLEIAVSGDYRTPTCPQCGVKMTLRQGQGQWRDFWGCPSYPRCKATLVYKSDTV